MCTKGEYLDLALELVDLARDGKRVMFAKTLKQKTGLSWEECLEYYEKVKKLLTDKKWGL